MHRPTRVLILLITLLAAFTRWHALDQARTLWDDAYPITQALRLIELGHWPLLGQPATFFFSNPPGQAYLSVLPLLAFGSLWGVFWWTSALNLLAVPALYRLGRLLGGERLGLLAALFFAVSPWVVRYSRWTASNSLTPLAATLVLSMLVIGLARLETSRRNGKRLLVGAAAILTVYTQTYTLGLLLMPIQAAAVLATRWRQLPWRAIFVGVALFTLAAASYGVTLWRQWDAQAGRLEALSTPTEPDSGFELRPDFLLLAARYVTGAEYHGQIYGRPTEVTPEWLKQAVEVSALGMAALLVTGVCVAAARWRRRAPLGWAFGAVLAWWLTPTLLLSYANRGPYAWHALVTLPAGHLLAALGLCWVWGGRRALTPVVTAVALVIASIAWLSFDVDNRFNRDFPVHPDRGAGILDQVTVSAALKIGQAVRQATSEQGIRQFFAPLPDPTLPAWTGLSRPTQFWFNDPALLVAPLDQAALYIRLGRDGPPPALPFAQRLALLDLGHTDVVALDAYPARSRTQAAALPAVRLDWPSEAGRTLLGYTWEAPPRPGQTVTLLTFWLIENVPPDVDEYLYGPYLHLNAPGGGTVVNVNGLAIEGYFPRPGDLLLQPIIIPVPADLPPGDYGLELGLYDGVHQVGTTFFPPGGVPQPFYTEVVAVKP